MAHTFKVGDKVLVDKRGVKVFTVEDATLPMLRADHKYNSGEFHKVWVRPCEIAPLGDIADDIEGVPAALEAFADALVAHHQDPESADCMCDIVNAASALKMHAQRLADKAERLFKEWEGTPPT